MKDAYSAESNDIPIFQFLFSELWLIVFTSYTPYFPSVSPTKKKFKRGQIYMKDAESAETNEKSIHRFLCFLFFVLCSILYSNFIENSPILNTKSTISQKLEEKNSGTIK